MIALIALASGLVNPESPETIEGVEALRAAGLITDADAKALLF